VDITIRRLSDGQLSPRLCDAELGQEFDVKGPFGVFTYPPGTFSDLLFVAGGTGVAPFRAMIRHIEDTGGAEKVRMLYSVRTPEDVIYGEELAQWEKTGRLKLLLTATRGGDGDWSHRRGRFQEDALEEALVGCDPMCYLCGPKEMLLQMQGWLLGRGLDRKKVKREAWG
jgi:ferredoxin-NADP reductase